MSTLLGWCDKSNQETSNRLPTHRLQCIQQDSHQRSRLCSHSTDRCSPANWTRTRHYAMTPTPMQSEQTLPLPNLSDQAEPGDHPTVQYSMDGQCLAMVAMLAGYR